MKNRDLKEDFKRHFFGEFEENHQEEMWNYTIMYINFLRWEFQTEQELIELYKKAPMSLKNATRRVLGLPDIEDDRRVYE